VKIPAELKKPLPIILMVVLTVFGMCCFGSVVALAFSPGSHSSTPPQAIAPVLITTTTTTTPAALAAPTTSDPTTETTDTTPEPLPTPEQTSTTTTKAPKPPTPRTTTRTTTKSPTPSKTYQGVHPGAFCSPHWAFGLTSAGTLMQCKPSATDSRFRWRKA